MNKNKFYSLLTALLFSTLAAANNDEAPAPENDDQIIAQSAEQDVEQLQEVSKKEAQQLVEHEITALEQETQFSLNQHDFVVDDNATAQKALTPAEQQAAEALISTVVSDVVPAIVQEIEKPQTTNISQAAAAALLQAYAESLTTGSTFSFNGVNYTVTE